MKMCAHQYLSCKYNINMYQYSSVNNVSVENVTVPTSIASIWIMM